jgi:hypothetical protein
VSKFTSAERTTVRSIVATMSIKKIPESEIIREIERQTSKVVSRRFLGNIKQQIKKESAKWYSQLRQSEFEYLYEFKERVNEIADLQRRHYQILDSDFPTTVKQASLIALHKLNVTLANYFDIVPYLTVTGQRQTQEQTEAETQRNTVQMDVTGNYTKMPILDNCQCRLNGGDTIRHNECRYCLHIWCPKALGQDWCPNPQCAHGIAGCKFQPYDENYTWIECSCKMWFQRKEILDAHLSAYQHNV